MNSPQNEPTEPESDPITEAISARFKAVWAARNQNLEAFLKDKPKSLPCERHPNVVLDIDFFRSSADPPEVAYQPCPACADERKEAQMQKFLQEAGVSDLALLGSTLENWLPSTETEVSNLEAVRKFVVNRRGFLVLLGGVGTGKGHLAVGAMRDFRSPRFIEQSTLLRRLRKSYRERDAVDPIEECQKADLFVLDEIGLSAGGRDEFPLLSDVLDYRYRLRLPTIITGNIQPEGLGQILGERLADRLTQPECGRILTLSGPSHRASKPY